MARFTGGSLRHPQMVTIHKIRENMSLASAEDVSQVYV